MSRCGNCDGKEPKGYGGRWPRYGLKSLYVNLKELGYLDEEGWFICPSCGDKICGGVTWEGGLDGCRPHIRDPDEFDAGSVYVCADCCYKYYCPLCCNDCNRLDEDCECEY